MATIKRPPERLFLSTGLTGLTIHLEDSAIQLSWLQASQLHELLADEFAPEELLDEPPF